MIFATEEEINKVRPRCQKVVTYAEYLFYCVREQGHEGECHYIKYKKMPYNEEKI